MADTEPTDVPDDVREAADTVVAKMLSVHAADKFKFALRNLVINAIMADRRARPSTAAVPGEATPIAWVTAETLHDLRVDAPWATGAIGELSQRWKDEFTEPLYASPPGESDLIARAHKAVDDYVDALVARQHGGTAQHVAFFAICRILGRNTTAETDAKRDALTSLKTAKEPHK